MLRSILVALGLSRWPKCIFVLKMCLDLSAQMLVDWTISKEVSAVAGSYTCMDARISIMVMHQTSFYIASGWVNGKIVDISSFGCTAIKS